jgi:chromosome partitioning protein
MQARSILILNAKGGCGKTTIATNLASFYAREGYSTLLFDFDRQRSSLQWIDQRPPGCPKIRTYSGWNQLRYPDHTARVIMDPPAHLEQPELANLITRSDLILVPVLPSPLDIRAATEFIGSLLINHHLRERNKHIAVIANRVRERTLVYGRLTRFLESLGIPFVTSLRDSQNYIRAAAQGMGIFEMPFSHVACDLAQWRPLINWLENNTHGQEIRHCQ